MSRHLRVVPPEPDIKVTALYLLENAKPRQVYLFLFKLREQANTLYPFGMKWRDEIDFIANAQDLSELMAGLAKTHNIP